MNKEQFDTTNNAIEYINTLKVQLKDKIVHGNLFDVRDQTLIAAIKSQSLDALHTVIAFCEQEHADKNYPQNGIIVNIRCALMKNLDFNDSNKITVSLLETLTSPLDQLKRYINTADTESFVDDIHAQSTDTDVVIDEDDVHDHSPEISDQAVVPSREIKKTDYLYRLTAERNNLLTNFKISEEIAEDNYEEILEEYREYLCSHEKRKQFETLLRKRVTLYKSNRSRNNKQYRMGEAMIFIQEFFKKQEVEEVDQFELERQEQQKELKYRQEQLRQQSIYFPQIIDVLEMFKQIFSSEYFTVSPQKIRECFVQQYHALVIEPIIRLTPELLSLSEKEIRKFGSTYRKKELYEGIPSVISNASDVLIERGISQGFIFGEINDLIENLQKLYGENTTS